jgi:hypothetical protein
MTGKKYEGNNVYGGRVVMGDVNYNVNEGKSLSNISSLMLSMLIDVRPTYHRLAVSSQFLHSTRRLLPETATRDWGMAVKID